MVVPGHAGMRAKVRALVDAIDAQKHVIGPKLTEPPKKRSRKVSRKRHNVPRVAKADPVLRAEQDARYDEARAASSSWHESIRATGLLRPHDPSKQFFGTESTVKVAAPVPSRKTVGVVYTVPEKREERRVRAHHARRRGRAKEPVLPIPEDTNPYGEENPPDLDPKPAPPLRMPMWEFVGNNPWYQFYELSNKFERRLFTRRALGLPYRAKDKSRTRRLEKAHEVFIGRYGEPPNLNHVNAMYESPSIHLFHQGKKDGTLSFMVDMSAEETAIASDIYKSRMSGRVWRSPWDYVADDVIPEHVRE